MAYLVVITYTQDTLFSCRFNLFIISKPINDHYQKVPNSRTQFGHNDTDVCFNVERVILIEIFEYKNTDIQFHCIIYMFKAIPYLSYDQPPGSMILQSGLMKDHGQQARASENFAGHVYFETPRPDLPVPFLKLS